MMPEERRYGFFECDSCGRHWESANVYCKKDEYVALYGQECSRCKEGMVFPYKVERLKCPRCGSKDGCDCFDEESSEDDDEDDDDDYKKRHNDPTKAHRSELCGRCRSGKPCRHA